MIKNIYLIYFWISLLFKFYIHIVKNWKALFCMFILQFNLKKIKLILICFSILLTFISSANAKYASFLINENTKRIYHNSNADTRNYPASLTKIMTLYMIFDALKSKKISMNTKF